MNKKFFTIYTILILLELSTISYSQQFGKLRGFVVDSTNGEALAFGNVFIDELKTGASTDIRGYFLINNIPAGDTLTAVVTYVGYESKRISFTTFNDEITTIHVHLVPSSYQLQAVEKVGRKVIEENATDIGLQKLTLRDLEMIPKGVETDVFRSLQSLPGVKSTGDVSARYYVRGGTSDQNLVLLNGMTIYNPFHALGLFSVIDPEMINGIEFYKGGFASEYGGRLSSVLSVITKDGNKSAYSTRVSSSFLSGKILLEGPIPDGSFMLTGRKSYSNSILKEFLNDQNVPIDFYDLSFKVNYAAPEFLENAKFSVFGFYSGDKLDYKNPARENFAWNNNLFGVEWLQIYDAPLFSRIAIASSSFFGEIVPNGSTLKPRRNELNDVTSSVDFTYVFDSKDEFDAGIALKILSAKLFSQNKRGVETNIEDISGNFSIYTKYKILRFNSFGVDAGTRINLVGLTEKGGMTFEPRLNLTYRIIPEIALKAAAGIYYQELSTVSDENEVISLFEPWLITPDYLEPAKAIHYTAGIDLDFTESLSGVIETYYKEMKSIPSINENKNFQFEPDLIAGNGQSYGWEFLMQYSTLPLSVSASYSLSWAYKSIGEYLYYPKYDTRHQVNLSIDYDLGWGVRLSSAWSYSSGLPYTQLLGFYDKYYFNDVYGDPNRSGNYNPFTILGDKNLGRLPQYHRMDVGLSKKFIFSSLVFDLDLSIINVYNRKNIFYFKRDTGERVNMLPFLPTATLSIEI